MNNIPAIGLVFISVGVIGLNGLFKGLIVVGFGVIFLTFLLQ